MSTAQPPRAAKPGLDSLYHRLFAFPIMVEQLVREFVPEVVALGLDFSRMVRVNVKFHARKDRRREADVIWRLPTDSGTDIYLHLLLEFQSRVDWWMPVRTQVYAGLLLQDLIKAQRLKPGDRLPPVLSIVIYNGDPRWNAPVDLASLIALPGGSPLWAWQPQARYYLLDEGAFPADVLARSETLAALLFRLEHCHELDDLTGLIDQVIGWFRQHSGYDALKELFTELVAQAAHNTAGGEAIPIPDDLLENNTMLATRAAEWRRQILAQGMAQGRAEGKTEGKAEALLLLLRHRYQVVPGQVESLVRAADIGQLDQWTERFVQATSLSDIFGPDMAH